MKKFNDDDIEVLGSEFRRDDRKFSRNVVDSFSYRPEEKSDCLEEDSECCEESLPFPNSCEASVSDEVCDSSSMPLVKSARMPSQHPRRSRWVIIILLTGFVIVVIILAIVLASRPRVMHTAASEDIVPTQISSNSDENARMMYAVAEESVENPEGVMMQRGKLQVDSINDVAFSLVPVGNLKASVTFEEPKTSDQSVIVATPAADWRSDNGGIVGEFIQDKKYLSRGIRKEGWCYIAPDGSLTIGIGMGEDAKKRALNEGGWFFRQFALVMDGEVTPNTLKGKYLRRALGFLDGKPYIVKSHGRESLYDFSQALADYGFSHAIYLPGGDGWWINRATGKTEIIDKWHQECPNESYLVFK